MTGIALENQFTGERLVLRRVPFQGESDHIEIEGSLPPGRAGPPPHAHPQQDEEGTVLSGELTVQVDGRTLIARAGDRVVFPAGAVHTWWNAGEATATFRGRVTPALNFDRILHHFFDAINRSTAGRPNLFETAFLLRTYRQEYRLAVIPDLVQQLLFGPVVKMGTALNKYDEYTSEALWGDRGSSISPTASVRSQPRPDGR